MRFRFSLRVGAVAVATALLAACGSGDSGGGNGGDGGGGDAGEPQSGGTLRVVQLSEPRLLDPAVMANLTSSNTLVGNSLYGQLLTVDADGEVEYGLAESLETSDGGTTWQLTLREGLTFTDGTPFDAAAVQFNWERLQDPTLGSASIAVAAYIETMTASGQVLEFTLALPIARFGSAIAEQSLNWIASPQALQAGPAAFDADPAGAGPFVLESWQRNGEMVLVRNEDYYDSPRPYLDELVLTANPDGPQRLSTLASGGADSIITQAELLAAAEDQGMSGIQLDLGGGFAVALNTRIAPFDDVRARQAVAHAVDMNAVSAAAYEGVAEVPETLFRDGSPYNGDATLPEHDPEAAQELFDELAAEGRPVEFLISTFQTTQSRRVAETFQAQLNQYDNVQVEIEVLDFPAATAKTAQRTFEMAVSGIFFDEPALTLYSALHSESAGNVTGISDPALDEAVLASMTASDEEARTQARQDVAELFSELVPYAIYVRSGFGMAYADHVHDVTMYGLGGVRTDRIWVSE